MNRSPITDHRSPVFQSGDILLFSGCGFTSELIRWATSLGSPIGGVAGIAMGLCVAAVSGSVVLGVLAGFGLTVATLCLLGPSPYSHVGIICNYAGATLLWESTTLSDLACVLCGKRSGGVHAVVPHDRIRTYRGRVWHMPIVRPLESHEIGKLVGFLLSHDGDSYDALGAASAGRWLRFLNPVHEQMQTWFCSDLVVRGLKECGVLMAVAWYAGSSKSWNPDDVGHRLPAWGFYRHPTIIDKRSKSGGQEYGGQENRSGDEQQETKGTKGLRICSAFPLLASVLVLLFSFVPVSVAAQSLADVDVQITRGGMRVSGSVISCQAGHAKILTCAHGFQSAKPGDQVQVKWLNGYGVTGAVVKIDPGLDLALVECEVSREAVAVSVTDDCTPDKIPSELWALTRQGDATVPRAVKLVRYKEKAEEIFVTPPTQFGFSGSGLFDSTGHLIGVLSHGDRPNSRGDDHYIAAKEIHGFLGLGAACRGGRCRTQQTDGTSQAARPGSATGPPPAGQATQPAPQPAPTPATIPPPSVSSPPSVVDFSPLFDRLNVLEAALNVGQTGLGEQIKELASRELADPVMREKIEALLARAAFDPEIRVKLDTVLGKIRDPELHDKIDQVIGHVSDPETREKLDAGLKVLAVIGDRTGSIAGPGAFAAVSAATGLPLAGLAAWLGYLAVRRAKTGVGIQSAVSVPQSAVPKSLVTYLPIRCPSCTRTLNVRSSFMGKRCTCGFCGYKFFVPVALTPEIHGDASVPDPRVTHPGTQSSPQSSPQPVSQPAPIFVESEPLPQVVRTNKEYVPYEAPNKEALAYHWAHERLAHKFPGATGTLETIESLKNQYLSGIKK